MKISDSSGSMLCKVNGQSYRQELRSFSNTVGTPAFTETEFCMKNESHFCPALYFLLIYGR